MKTILKRLCIDSIMNDNELFFQGMLKTFNVDIPDCDDAEFYLDFGKCLILSTSYYCFFLIYNGYYDSFGILIVVFIARYTYCILISISPCNLLFL